MKNNGLKKGLAAVLTVLFAVLMVTSVAASAPEIPVEPTVDVGASAPSEVPAEPVPPVDEGVVVTPPADPATGTSGDSSSETIAPAGDPVVGDPVVGDSSPVDSNTGDPVVSDPVVVDAATGSSSSSSSSSSSESISAASSDSESEDLLGADEEELLDDAEWTRTGGPGAVPGSAQTTGVVINVDGVPFDPANPPNPNSTSTIELLYTWAVNDTWTDAEGNVWDTGMLMAGDTVDLGWIDKNLPLMAGSYNEVLDVKVSVDTNNDGVPEDLVIGQITFHPGEGPDGNVAVRMTYTDAVKGLVGISGTFGLKTFLEIDKKTVPSVTYTVNFGTGTYTITFNYRSNDTLEVSKGFAGTDTNDAKFKKLNWNLLVNANEVEFDGRIQDQIIAGTDGNIYHKFTQATLDNLKVYEVTYDRSGGTPVATERLMDASEYTKNVSGDGLTVDIGINNAPTEKAYRVAITSEVTSEVPANSADFANLGRVWDKDGNPITSTVSTGQLTRPAKVSDTKTGTYTKLSDANSASFIALHPGVSPYTPVEVVKWSMYLNRTLEDNGTVTVTDTVGAGHVLPAEGVLYGTWPQAYRVWPINYDALADTTSLGTELSASAVNTLVTVNGSSFTLSGLDMAKKGYYVEYYSVVTSKSTATGAGLTNTVSYTVDGDTHEVSKTVWRTSTGGSGTGTGYGTPTATKATVTGGLKADAANPGQGTMDWKITVDPKGHTLSGLVVEDTFSYNVANAAIKMNLIPTTLVVTDGTNTYTAPGDFTLTDNGTLGFKLTFNKFTTADPFNKPANTDDVSFKTLVITFQTRYTQREIAGVGFASSTYYNQATVTGNIDGSTDTWSKVTEKPYYTPAGTNLYTASLVKNGVFENNPSDPSRPLMKWTVTASPMGLDWGAGIIKVTDARNLTAPNRIHDVKGTAADIKVYLGGVEQTYGTDYTVTGFLTSGFAVQFADGTKLGNKEISFSYYTTIPDSVWTDGTATKAFRNDVTLYKGTTALKSANKQISVTLQQAEDIFSKAANGSPATDTYSWLLKVNAKDVLGNAYYNGEKLDKIEEVVVKDILGPGQKFRTDGAYYPTITASDGSPVYFSINANYNDFDAINLTRTMVFTLFSDAAMTTKYTLEAGVNLTISYNTEIDKATLQVANNMASLTNKATLDGKGFSNTKEVTETVRRSSSSGTAQASMVPFRILKVDADTGAGLQGAEFAISSTTNVNDAFKTGITTDENGYTPEFKILTGIYYVFETKAPDGYDLSQPNMQMMAVSAAAAENMGGVITKTFENALTVYELQVLKVDAESPETAQVPLQGAIFDLYNAEGDAFVATLTTNESGLASAQDLLPGDYYLVETQAPDGYDLPADPKFPFTLVKEPVGSAPHVFQMVIGNAATPVYDIQVVKVDADKTTLTLPGAAFELKDAGGNVLRTGTTDANGEANFFGLVAGTYTLTETKAPKGYDLPANPVTTVTLPDDAVDGVAVVTVVNAKTPLYDLQVMKVDSADGTTPLEGAVFNLKDANGNLLGTGTTGANGVADFFGLLAGTYTLTETKAPTGYDLPANPVTTVTLPDDAVDGVAVVTVVNAKTPPPTPPVNPPVDPNPPVIPTPADPGGGGGGGGDEGGGGDDGGVFVPAIPGTAFINPFMLLGFTGAGTGLETIANQTIPLVEMQGGIAWSLLNLMMALTALFSAILLLGSSFKKSWKKPADEQETDENGEEQEKEVRTRRTWLRLIAILASFIPAVLFLLLENVRLPVVWITQWTPLIGAAFIVSMITVLVHFVATKHVDTDEETADESAN